MNVSLTPWEQVDQVTDHLYYSTEVRSGCIHILQAAIARLNEYAATHSDCKQEAKELEFRLNFKIRNIKQQFDSLMESTPATTFFSCIGMRDLPSLKLLVWNGHPGIDQTNRRGLTPLELARQLKFTEAEEVLLLHPSFQLGAGCDFTPLE